jgi:serine protease Do
LTVLSLLVDARRVRVVTPDGAKYEAEVLYRDPERQLTLLRMRNRDATDSSAGTSERSTAETPRVGPFPFFDLDNGAPLPRDSTGSSTTPDAAHTVGSIAPGDWIIAAGNAFKVADGGEPVSIAHGVFSVRTRMDARRRVRDFPYRGDILVIDAVTSNPGAPGGAVVNIHGELVGLIGRDVMSNLTHTHFNYAVPRDVLADFFREASSNPECRIATPEGPSEMDAAALAGITADAALALPPARVDFGFRLQRAGYRTVLPFVERVRPESPAAKAGLRNDDLILSVNGRNVSSVQECDGRIQDAGSGGPLELVVRRERRVLAIRIEGE